MASSSKSSDVFRPRLPADPYAFERPWLVPTAAVDALLSDKFLSRQVILVLGDIPSQELYPLLQSSLFSDSLLLMVTHNPPKLPPSSQLMPYVYVLRTLNPPSSQEASSAVYLVNVLDRAHRIVQEFRRSAPVERLTQLCESEPGSDFTVKEGARASRRASIASKLTKASPSTSHIRTSGSDRAFDAVLNFVSPEMEESAVLKQVIVVTTMSQPYITASGANHTRPAMPSTPTSFRPGSFYGATSPSSERLSVSPNNTWSKRASSSFLKGKGSAQSAPSTPMNLSRDSLLSMAESAGKQTARVIHVLPPKHHLPAKTVQAHLTTRPAARPRQSPPFGSVQTKLVQRIEHFLLSFSYPGYKNRVRTGSSSSSRPSSVHSFQSDMSSVSDMSRIRVPNSHRPADAQKPYQYLLASHVFTHVPQETTLTVGELLLRGGLDPVDSSPAVPYDGSRGPSLEHLGQYETFSPRVWIGKGSLVQVSDEEKSADYILEEDVDSSPPPVVPVSVPSSRRKNKRQGSLPTPPLSSGSSDEAQTASDSEAEEPTPKPLSPASEATQQGQSLRKKPSRWKFWKRFASHDHI